jgi:predicted xylose isomerase-like sugar epimerase
MNSDVIATAADAAHRVRAADNGRDFREAVRHFRHVLSTMPEESLAEVTPDGAHQLEQLGNEVIECIEVNVPQETMFEARGLVDAIYQIRALLEEAAGYRLHGAANRRHE